MQKQYPPYFYGDDEDAEQPGIGINPDYATGKTGMPWRAGMDQPQKPKEPTPEEALRAYLMQRKSEDDALRSPEALQKKEADKQLAMDRQTFNTFLPTFEKAGAMLGTSGGVTPKTVLEKPAQQWMDFYKDQNKNEQFDERMGLERTGMNDRLVEYLTNMQRQKDEAQKGRDQQLTVLDKTQGFQTGRDENLHGYDMEKQQTGIDAGMDKQNDEQEWRTGENVLDRKNREEVAKLGGNKAVQRIRVQGEEARKTNAAKPTKKPGGKPLTSTAAGQLGSYNGALNMLDQLETSYEALASERGSGIKSMIKGSPAYNFEQTRKAYAQGIGKVLEKGKLSNADYESKYVPLMPGAWDTDATARIKLNNMRAQIRAQRQGELEGYGQGGYDISGYGNITGKDEGSKSANSMPANSKAKLILQTMKKNPAALNNAKARKYIIDNAPELRGELDDLVRKSGVK